MTQEVASSILTNSTEAKSPRGFLIPVPKVEERGEGLSQSSSSLDTHFSPQILSLKPRARTAPSENQDTVDKDSMHSTACRLNLQLPPSYTEHAAARLKSQKRLPVQKYLALTSLIKLDSTFNQNYQNLVKLIMHCIGNGKQPISILLNLGIDRSQRLCPETHEHKNLVCKVEV